MLMLTLKNSQKNHFQVFFKAILLFKKIIIVFEKKI